MRVEPVSNEQGILDLCEVAATILRQLPVNAASKFAVREVLRLASNKSRKHYRGNNNKLNASYASVCATKAGPETLIADHAIPLSLMLEMVYIGTEWSKELLAALVRKYSTIVLITRDEDAALLAAGLKKRMPADWDGEDVLARYHHVGLDVEAVSAG